MPNTLTTIFRTVPSTEPAEAPHPNTGVYVTGTQLADGTWQVVHTAITKTTNPLTMVGRMKNFPAVTASIVASGNIANIQQAAPGGTSAVGISTTSINVTASSSPSATAYRFLFSTAQAGPFALLIQQASATYNHTGVTAGGSVWYQMQYVGGGFVDDSPVSAAFKGTTTVSVSSVAATDGVVVFINGQSNAQGNAEATEATFAPMDTFSPNVTQSFATVKIWNVATNIFENMVVGTNTRSDATNTYPQGYTYAAKADGTWDVGNAAAKYNITGVGPEYGLADAWKTLGSTVPIYIVKFCEGGTSINRWLKSANDLYPKLLLHKQNAFANLTAAGKNIRVLGFFRNQGEADATMLATDYQAKLTQLYADLTADGFITSETKIVEVATPTTNDTGTPVTYAAELTAKQNFAAAAPNRYVFDAAGIALEHDEIHWNLATQYNYGFVRLSNLLFNGGLALPASVQPPAPTIAFNSTTSIVTVTPPSAAWPQKEFYYTINGSAPKRLTTTFTFPIPGGVTAATGQVQVFSRAVPGRVQSAAAINTASWVGVTVSNYVNWLTASGRYTTMGGSGATTTLYRSGGTSAWDAFAPGSLKIMPPAVGFVGEVARLVVPDVPSVSSAVVLGVAKAATIATKDNMYAGIYVDPSPSYGFMHPISTNVNNFVTGTSFPFTTSTGLLTLIIYDNRIEFWQGNVLKATLTENPFAGTTALWVMGITYGLAGWAAGQQTSQIVGATVTGSTLVAF